MRRMVVPMLTLVAAALVAPMVMLLPDLASQLRREDQWASVWRVERLTVAIAGLAALGAVALATALALAARVWTRKSIALLLAVLVLPIAVQLTFRMFMLQTLATRLGDFIPAVSLAFTTTGTVIGLIHYLLPFAAPLMIVAARRVDPELYEVATLLGARAPARAWHITLPAVLPAITATLVLTFALGYGAYVTPALLGSIDDLTASRDIGALLSEGRAGAAVLSAFVAAFVPLAAAAGLILLFHTLRPAKRHARS